MLLNYSIGELSNLQVLDIRNNRSLTAIPQSLFQIEALQEVHCDYCNSLTSPPLALCKQGVRAVRKYFYDLKVEKGSNQLLIPVTVIGKSRAGKTSLVQSVKKSKRVLTNRDTEEGRIDAATKVFKVVEAEVSDVRKLIFTDFGGHNIYHVSYQLTFKTQSVPLLVIDIAEFDKLANKNGVESACRELCIDWLSHLYLSCPRLQRPIVALTHSDQVTEECLKHRRQQLIEVTEQIRVNIIQTEQKFAYAKNPILTMTSFADLTNPLISDNNIMTFSDISTESDIDALKAALTDAGSGMVTELPGSWYRQLLKITEQKDKSFIELSDIDKEFPEDEEHVVLEYLHDAGSIMWYKNIVPLSNIVFHRAGVLIHLIQVLYNHTQDDEWEKRLNNFKEFVSDGKSVGKEKYTAMIDNFKDTGVMEGTLLLNLLKIESQELPTNIALEILKTFHLLYRCGPPDAPASCQKYIFPYFAKRTITAPNVHTHLTPLKVDLLLCGLPVPTYVFSLITAAYLGMNSSPENYPEVGENGAIVRNENGLIKYLIHNPSEKCVTFMTLTPIEDICQAWKDMLNSLKMLITDLKSVWKGVRYENVFYCSHCLITYKSNPTKTVDPDWFQVRSTHSELSNADAPSTAVRSYTGRETAVCRKETEREKQRIPKPLMVPCKFKPI